MVGKISLGLLKRQVHIFIDQCVGIGELRDYLKNDGFLSVDDVKSINHVGASDDKLLKMIIENKMILVTYDKDFRYCCVSGCFFPLLRYGCSAGHQFFSLPRGILCSRSLRSVSYVA